MGNDLSPQSKEKYITIKGQVPPPETISLSNCSQKVYPRFLKKYPHLKHLLFVHQSNHLVPPCKLLHTHTR